LLLLLIVYIWLSVDDSEYESVWEHAEDADDLNFSWWQQPQESLLWVSSLYTDSLSSIDSFRAWSISRKERVRLCERRCALVE